MTDPVCVKCSKPILSIEGMSTVKQVDACTMIVQHVTYHAACLEGQEERPAARRPANG